MRLGVTNSGLPAIGLLAVLGCFSVLAGAQKGTKPPAPATASATAVKADAAKPAPPVSFTPTVDELKDLRLAYSEAQTMQVKAQLAEQVARDAEEAYRQQLVALQAAGEKIRVDEKWPASVLFDMNNLLYCTQEIPSQQGMRCPAPASASPVAPK